MMKNIHYKSIILLSCFLLLANTNLAQEQKRFIISGKVINKEGCALSGTMIVLSPKQTATEPNDAKKAKLIFTDKGGFFKLESDSSYAHLNISQIGMKDRNNIFVKSDSTYTIVMQEKPKQSGEILYRKPVIYLYPQQETEIEVLVNFDGKFSYTYPNYNEGWRVMAKPTGELTDKANDLQYNYLFWEGTKYPTITQEQLQKGFVIEGKETTNFLKEILPALGLLPNEYNDFIVFWAPLMIKNKWNYIYFLTGEEYDAISTNTVKPIPDTNIRVFMYYKALDEKINIFPQILNTTSRNGFTLVEWGGAEL